MLRTVWLLLFVLSPAAKPQWRVETPESQGMDSRTLSQVISRARERQAGIHSLLVIRHGTIVLDTYFYPFAPGIVHDAASVTKTITSTLIGIAESRGLLKTGDRVLPFFPEEEPGDSTDMRKQRLTVDDLLTMRPGLDCGFLPGEQELERMRRTPDWVRAALALPTKYDPGTKFGYCSPGYHLLSSVLSAAAHQNALEFARRHLFAPLGIREVIWPEDQQGRTHGWGNSHLLPHDLTKLGYLFLHGGLWDGKQVVPAEWVRRATAVHTNVRPGVDYGYGWWLHNDTTPRTFEANGRGGQRIVVAPEKDMVIVLTGGGYSPDEIIAALFQAVKSDTPLAEQPEALRELRTKTEASQKAPAPSPVPAPSAIAARISGRRFDFPINPSRIESISLTFPKSAEATAWFRMLGEEFTLPLGLDGVYRIAPQGPYRLPAGAKGQWVSPEEFLLDINLVANINHYTLRLRFLEDRVDATIGEASGLAANLRLRGTYSYRSAIIGSTRSARRAGR